MAVGVPEIIPVLAARLSPVGSCPLEMLHVYGVVPPVAASVAVYADPTTPWGTVVEEIVSVEGAVVFAGAITTGTACDAAIVCVF